ncbi:ABC transporter ATP-binding protein [Clostridium sp. Marseille-P299]|uniref:ABC transporter ATP-binding protein n=1 Tax=Clostridium sp. Marseille-P299 TaxID=1805477 RepID=UPI0008341114|nr:ABC transporter ATP-binding protein [Clostridium sp. Marseille-P299]
MTEKQSYPILPTLKRLLDNITNQDKKIYLYFAIYTIAAAIYPFFAIVLPKLLITELSLGERADLVYVVGIIGGYFILTSIFGFIRTYINGCTYPRLTKLRLIYIKDVFDKIISVDYKHMEDSTFFDKNERAFSATSSNNNGIEGIYHKLFGIPATLLTITVLTFFIGRLNLFVLLGLIMNIGVTIFIQRSVHNFQYKKKEELAHAERRKGYYYKTTHDFTYGKDIRLYQLKERILSNYNKEIEKYLNIHKLIKNREFLLGILSLITLILSDAITYGVLIIKTLNGMSIADFSMYLAAVAGLSLMLKTVAGDIAFIINEGQYVYDYFNFIEKDLGEKGGTREAIKDDTLEVVFDNVSFCYPGTDKYIFKNLNFTIHKGERLAIVGINGAGKSTLVKLMVGLFDVTEGEIRINGIPIKEFDKKQLFSMFSVVFQDVNILAFTVKENVACSSVDIDEERVNDALQRVGLKEKIEKLPKGMEQMMLKIIEEDGAELSGGESQKLSIARALYKGGNMVIMDEPTAALDALAEAEIYENFSELVKGKTSVYISHRLASTKFCDKIALFDGTGLKEYGNHDELMKLEGDYYHMFSVQGKYYTEGAYANE